MLSRNLANLAADRSGTRTRVFAAACLAWLALGVQSVFAQGANRLESVQANSLPGHMSSGLWPSRSKAPRRARWVPRNGDAIAINVSTP